MNFCNSWLQWLSLGFNILCQKLYNETHLSSNFEFCNSLHRKTWERENTFEVSWLESGRTQANRKKSDFKQKFESISFSWYLDWHSYIPNPKQVSYCDIFLCLYSVNLDFNYGIEPISPIGYWSPSSTSWYVLFGVKCGDNHIYTPLYIIYLILLRFRSFILIKNRFI